MLDIKDVRKYDAKYGDRIRKGGALICPRCKGGHGKSEIAKKKKYKDITNIPCFTCWGWLEKEQRTVMMKSELTAPLLSTRTKVKRRRGRGMTERKVR